MSVSTRNFDYAIDGRTFEGFVAAPEETPAPAVLIAHAWKGRSEFEDDKAKALAELGYTGIAVDLFGKGNRGQSREECQALIAPFVEDRQFLQQRLAANIEVVKEQPETDVSKVGAIGFCFGGLCVLDIARMGADAAGVVSFHGLLGAPGNTVDKIKAKILVLHGWSDPMAPPTDVVALGGELTEAKADWQLHGYGNTMHAFTNPIADDPDFGTVYDAGAERRSWRAMKDFLKDIFG